MKNEWIEDHAPRDCCDCYPEHGCPHTDPERWTHPEGEAPLDLGPCPHCGGTSWGW